MITVSKYPQAVPPAPNRKNEKSRSKLLRLSAKQDGPNTRKPLTGKAYDR